MTPLWQAELIDRLSAAPHGNRGAVIAGYMEMTGYSKQQVYRILKSHGYTSGKSRLDKGALQCGLTDDQINFVGALIFESRREKKGAIMPVETALGIAIDNGIIKTGQVSVATMSRLLREREIHAKSTRREEPHTEMRSLHPNHVHCLDASVCVQYYLKNGRTGLLDERDFHQKKPENLAKVKTRVLRYLLTDHFSGTIFPHYFEVSGETKENLFTFATRAWAHKGDERFPFRGVPFLILMDRGSANISKPITQFFEARLDIDIPPGLPHRPTRQGSVETAHNIWERHFESRLIFQPAFTVEELNSWALDFAAYFNATKRHTRHGMTRTQCWLLIKREQLRELPAEDILKDLFANPEEERTVDGTYSISFRGKEYQLKHVEGLYRGAKVIAILKPFKWPVIEVLYKERRYEVQPRPDRLPVYEGAFSASAAIIGQEYHAQPETRTQQAQKVFENMAYGEAGKKKNAVPFEGITVFGIHAEKVGNLAFMPKQGTPIKVDCELGRTLFFMEFLKRLVAETGPVSQELNAELRMRYGDSIDATEAEEVIKNVGAALAPPAEKKAVAL